MGPSLFRVAKKWISSRLRFLWIILSMLVQHLYQNITELNLLNQSEKVTIAYKVPKRVNLIAIISTHTQNMYCKKRSHSIDRFGIFIIQTQVHQSKLPTVHLIFLNTFKFSNLIKPLRSIFFNFFLKFKPYHTRYYPCGEFFYLT